LLCNFNNYIIHNVNISLHTYQQSKIQPNALNILIQEVIHKSTGPITVITR